VCADFLLILLRELLPRRPALRVILMSATADAALFAAYFRDFGAPLLHIPGVTHPVREMYLEDMLHASGHELTPMAQPRGGWRSGMNSDAAARADAASPDGATAAALSAGAYDALSGSARASLAAWAARRENDELDAELILAALRFVCASDSDGAILVFCTGWQDISDIAARCGRDPLLGDAARTRVLPLHGALSGGAQREVFARPPPGVRKVILATNVAETSITIDDVTTVIDCGRAKETRYDAVNALACLTSAWVSAAAAHQRRGRAGRTAPGAVLRLYTRAQHAALPPHGAPELLRTPLEGLCLSVLAMRVGHPATFLQRALQPPEPRAVSNAMALLSAIGALAHDAPHDAPTLSPLGVHLAALPVDPRIGKMLVTAAVLGCAPAAATVAAALAQRDPFVLPPPDKRSAADDARRRLAGGAPSDHIALLRAHAGWRAERRRCGFAAARAFASRNFLSHHALEMMDGMRAQFLDLLSSARLLSSSPSHDADADADLEEADMALLTGVICAGLYPCVAAASPAGRRLRVRTREDGRVEVHPCSVLSDASLLRGEAWLVYSDKTRTKQGVALRGCTALSDAALLLFGGPLLRDDADADADADASAAGEGIVSLRMAAPDGGAMRFTAPARTAALVLALRQRLDALLAAAAASPGLDVAACGGAELLAATRQLLREASALSHGGD
jgi:ATP-dependent RNA helicase DHX36